MRPGLRVFNIPQLPCADRVPLLYFIGCEQSRPSCAVVFFGNVSLLIIYVISLFRIRLRFNIFTRIVKLDVDQRLAYEECPDLETVAGPSTFTLSFRS
jgi:hypothetical protein